MNLARRALRTPRPLLVGRRAYASPAPRKPTPPVPKAAPPNKDKKEAPVYNFNTSLTFDAVADPEVAKYRRVTATELANFREPPTKVRMLVRDFIDDSLYNPHYGYFSKNVSIFTPPDGKGYDFRSFRDQNEFQERVAERYESEYGAESGLGRQVWHTPTELFKPHYARALTAAMVNAYKLNHYPHDFVIYEVGAGNGTFMIDALTFLKEEYPDIFARTKYRIVEISGALAKIQRSRAVAAGFDNVEVINQDVFKWQGGSTEPCYVVACEVFDNFSHDMIRYDMGTLEPMQASVAIDSRGDFSVYYEPLHDPLLRRVLAYRRLLPPSPSTQPPLSKPLLASSTLRKVYSQIPFAPNLSPPEFVPTKAVAFLERLRDQLPNHRLLVADFDTLPDAVAGRNGPVVQTRYGGTMVPCETFLVKQGYFDIFFPTDFELLRDTYSLIMNSPSRRATDGSGKGRGKLSNDFFTGVRGFRRRAINVYSQGEFVMKYGGREAIKATTTRDGMSVMLSMYHNTKVLF
ncbi:hypothetical protein CcaverHIS002_0505280 [Cutaneotrichosporon cavernicola]|uniref:Protein arginine methyltransferase NDUFAF7 n=1 Tax=Cutaneotrichosporon cavernicola TaxID=279322 RepID=A0AA48L6N9_9TREE|nr:uncharacterized protein CcaverHIS019_0505800 [Cutaneotrichosporon cavernicola]BEI85127.1 hypothetical protein CcaverHIS002_0505280 [Cutaneotrichosporon cavernicola]BEI92952.1 hypothetical protein CcaverHIS019_0505800 [Cutaneotrichosporon cavernicola]BEJ00728.1 hypothetical protein CcaverHIS631_0505850 [Cutaneotrichosporon cavernicola]BEJ08494.1 hypothetical protein CcaverHIS641_0505880 [Cutaneotrichosporon cavernicola]